MKRKILWIAADLLLAAVIVLGVWIVNYKLPKKDVKIDDLQKTKVLPDTQDWHKKFADKFTDIAMADDISYTSSNVSVKLSYHQYDTGKLDQTGDGKHEKYGTKISYVLADVYVGDITCLQTAFAQDTYGVGYTEKLSEMSSGMKAVLAVNGDSYSNDRHKENGTISSIPMKEGMYNLMITPRSKIILIPFYEHSSLITGKEWLLQVHRVTYPRHQKCVPRW